MVSTLMLKDTSDRTAYKVFEPGGTASLPGFGQANNLMLLADPASLRLLPWTASHRLGPVPAVVPGRHAGDAGHAARAAACPGAAGAAGLGLRCGLESSSTSTASQHDAQMDPTKARLAGAAPAKSA
jgi:glutamine synthetase